MKSHLYFTILLLFFGSNMYSQTESILIDFGNPSGSSDVNSWNNITDNSTEFISNLINSDNTNTGISVRVIDGFNGIGSPGTQATTGSASQIPSTASQDYFYGTSSDLGILEFKNLIVGKDYTFTMFASRTGVTGVRETQYYIEGLTIETKILDAVENTGNVVSATLKPRLNGTISLTVSTPAGSSSIYNYLNSLEISYPTDQVIYSDGALLIDFGVDTNTSANPWNNLTDPYLGGTISNLTNYSGSNSGISLSVTDAFNFVNENGTTEPGTSINIPGTATANSFFGNTIDYLGKIEPTGAVQFSNFSPNEDVEIKIYASRLDYIEPDNKETKYEIEGLTTETVYLNAANNTNAFVTASLKTKADGTITIKMSPGSNNTSPYQFFYLGAVVIEYTPEPSLALTSPNGDEFWQVGKVPSIAWESNSLSNDVTLEYSIDNGSTWVNIATVSSVTRSYAWSVPDDVSENCLVRVISGALTDASDDVFEISDDDSTCNIVVIGSSTAEGLGASTIENSWVYKYNEALFQKNTMLNVINLGLGGLTTYDLLPTESSTVLPSGVTIKTDRNITKALSYNPVAIILNLPSNDTSNGYSASTQLANFSEINAEATNSAIPIWITTTQPRYFSNPADVQTQRDVRDAILSTYTDKALDFWTDIAASDGTIIPNLNSGDGTHVNDEGHSILLNKVMDKNIDDLTCLTSTLSDNSLIGKNLSLKLFPNPLVEGDLNLNFRILNTGVLKVSFYNALGQKVAIQQERYNFKAGNNKLKVSVDHIKPQVLYCVFDFMPDGKATITKKYTLFVK